MPIDFPSGMFSRNTAKLSTRLALASLLLSACSSSDMVKLYKETLPGKSTESTLTYMTLILLGVGADLYVDSTEQEGEVQLPYYCNTQKNAEKTKLVLGKRSREARKLSSEYTEHTESLRRKQPTPTTDEILKAVDFTTEEQQFYSLLMQEEARAIDIASEVEEPYKTDIEPDIRQFLCTTKELKQKRRELNKILDKAIKAQGLPGWYDRGNSLSLLKRPTSTPAEKNRLYHKVIAQRQHEITSIRTFFQQSIDSLSRKNRMLTKAESRIVTQSIGGAWATLFTISDEIATIARGGDDKSLGPKLKKLRAAHSAAFTEYKQLQALLSASTEIN